MLIIIKYFFVQKVILIKWYAYLYYEQCSTE